MDPSSNNSSRMPRNVEQKVSGIPPIPGKVSRRTHQKALRRSSSLARTTFFFSFIRRFYFCGLKKNLGWEFVINLLPSVGMGRQKRPEQDLDEEENMDKTKKNTIKFRSLRRNVVYKFKFKSKSNKFSLLERCGK